MIPYLVTGPASDPVSLADMKDHLRVEHGDDDAKIAALQSGAVAMLDAHGGLLGRCMMSQEWAVDVVGPGPHLLPFPDATGVAADSGGEVLTVEVARSAMGQVVTISEALQDDEITITATYGLSAERLPAAQTLVKIIVEREYDGLVGPAYDRATRSIDALIDALRWGRVA